MTSIQRFAALALACLLPCLAWAGAWGTEAQEEANALAQVNLRRQQVGLPLVAANSQLMTAARGHANYLLQNNVTDHNQVAGAAGFTGVTPGDRISAAGYEASAYGEVLASGAYSGGTAVDALVQAIYHRFAIFGSAFDEVGTGVRYSADGGAFAIEFATRSYPLPAAPAGWAGVYPWNGQTGVTTDFYSNQESPDPVPNADRVGYPVSLHVDDHATLTMSSFTLESAGGAPVSALLLAPGDAHTPNSAAALVPLAPLAYGTTYVARFAGKVDGADLAKTWSFTTAPYLPLAIVAPTSVYVGDTVTLAFVGGSGVYANLGWEYNTEPGNTKWVGPDGFSFSANGVGVITFTVTDGDNQHASLTINVYAATAKPPAPSLALAPGWNLLGNGVEAAIDVAVLFGNPAKVTTVWKWLPASGKWAFYSPSMSAQDLATYAAAKGYDVLAAIDPGEGFWVNAASSFAVQLSAGQPVVTPSLAAGAPHRMIAGWNLVASGDGPTPAIVNSAVGGVTTIWAWDAAKMSWYFWSPTLASQGTLGAYIANKGYLDFGSGALGALTGFWVNKP